MSISSSSMGSTEILQIADAVAREKAISRNAVLEAMENSIQVAGRRKYGHKHNIKAEIDRKTGEIRLFRVYEVVEEVDNITTQMTIKDAKELDPSVDLGGFIYDLLPPIDLGRVAAQAAKQVIVYKVKEAERDIQFEAFKDRVGEIINGTIKRIEHGDIIVDIGRDEAILRRDGVIKTENFKVNDKIRAYIEDVSRVSKGPQIFLSRSHDNFLAKLFMQEVQEIYDGVISIKSVAREPGSRAKIAVYSEDSSIDPVGSCVGIRGARVQAVINELQGEKIDIIQWSADPATFVIRALSPADINKVVIDEDRKRIEVVVAVDQLSQAIGRRGQNVRLAHKLTGWAVDVLTEDQESKRRVDEFNTVTQLFMEALDIEEVMAQLLAAEGFTNIEEILMVNANELASIEGFDDDLAKALQERAEFYVGKKNENLIQKIQLLGVEDKLIDMLQLDLVSLANLAENGIKTIDDFADLTVEEFHKILPAVNWSDKKINDLINQSKADNLDDDLNQE